MTAGMRASIKIDRETGRGGTELAREPLQDGFQLGLGRRHSVVAMRVTDTSDRRGVSASGLERKSDVADAANHFVEPLRGNRGEDEVLPARQANIAADLFGQVGQSDHLPAAHQAELDREARVMKPGLLL